MTTAQYLAALKKLGLTSHGKATAEALGVSVRQLSYYAEGKGYTPMLERLLNALLNDNPGDKRQNPKA